jgi:uncharacterized protein YfaT (DUF1175 family)
LDGVIISSDFLPYCQDIADLSRIFNFGIRIKSHTVFVSAPTHFHSFCSIYPSYWRGHSTAIFSGVIIRFPERAALSYYLALRWWALALIGLIAGLTIALAVHTRTAPASLIITIDNVTLPANGYSQAWAHVRATDGRQVKNVTWRLESGRNIAEFEPDASDARLRAGVTPGDVALTVVAPGFNAARVDVKLDLDPTDQFGDGTPDFLRLQDASDQIAFRRWFVFLAEATYFEKEQDRPAEVNDCAALIRFAYREALRQHDGPWANSWHLPSLPNVTSVKKYDYPHTALGAGLFRTQPGGFTAEDLGNRAFAEFADAQTLWRYNTHLVSRDPGAARPGDLLFFRQAGHQMPFHAMIYLGRSYFDEGTDWLIYHTGPSEGHAGEIRRVTVRDLLQHPQVSWRPLPQNQAFLGVYRWNILREAD